MGQDGEKAPERISEEKKRRGEKSLCQEKAKQGEGPCAEEENNRGRRSLGQEKRERSEAATILPNDLAGEETPGVVLASKGERNWESLWRESLTSVEELGDLWGWDGERRESLGRVSERYPVRVPRYYASLIDAEDPHDPLARLALPDPRELAPSPLLCPDPLEEEKGMPVPRLIHLYRDRVVLLSTLTCAVYCRYCTRKRWVGRGGGALSPEELAAVVDYLQAHPEIHDVIVSGGEPLTLSDERLEEILSALRAVPSVEILRLGTRVPAVLPQRITSKLVQMLARYHPLFVNTHFNHPRELTSEAREACARLADAGLPLNNQTVLLAGVNDDPEVMRDLCRGLLSARIRPYYLLQCDLVQGIEHLRTPLSRGIEIMEALRGRLSGLGIPTFVVDAPYGSGKVPLTPNYILSTAPGRTVLRNFAGQIFAYPDPKPPPIAGQKEQSQAATEQKEQSQAATGQREQSQAAAGQREGRDDVVTAQLFAGAQPAPPPAAKQSQWPADGVAGVLGGALSRIAPEKRGKK